MKGDIDMKARKLPSGNWRVQLYCGKDENGKRIVESFTAPTKKEAERMAATFDGDRKQRAADRAAGRITLAQAMDAFIETCRATGKSPATINAYCSMRRTFVLCALRWCRRNISMRFCLALTLRSCAAKTVRCARSSQAYR